METLNLLMSCWVRTSNPVLLIMGSPCSLTLTQWMLNNTKIGGNFMGNEGQDPTSESLWVSDSSLCYQSGILPRRGNLCPIQEPPPSGAIMPGELRKYGTMIAPSLYAPVHQHFFVARMDMAVDSKPSEALAFPRV
ncbi:hypothetical protein AHAS_Ahas14G0231800 [Arachis hypogaea]